MYLKFQINVLHVCVLSSCIYLGGGGGKKKKKKKKSWLNNPSELGNYRPYSSARVNESTTPFTKNLP